MLGEFRRLYQARTRIEELRTHRGGGDVVTTLLVYALEKGIIGQALVTKMSELEPWRAVPIIATSREEIVQSSGSKYVFVPHAALRRQMASGAVVGLPCQISRCPEKLLRIGLFCGLNSSPRALDYALRKHGISKPDIQHLDYRAPHRVRLAVELTDGNVKYIKMAALPLFFPYSMCLPCTDFSSHNADVSVGDRCFKGWSTVVVRTERGEELFRKVVEDCYIEADPISKKDIVATRTSSMLQKEIAKGYINTRFVRVRGRWIEAVPFRVLDLLGRTYLFYQKFIKRWPMGEI